MEFFGGVDVVTCPVDDPSPLTRINDLDPVPEHKIDLFKELAADYYLRKGNMTLLQVGEIAAYGQGSDGPLEKVVRHFMVDGGAVTLTDMKAGVEHFGSRIPDRMDVILGVLDYTLESVSIAIKNRRILSEGGNQEFRVYPQQDRFGRDRSHDHGDVVEPAGQSTWCGAILRPRADKGGTVRERPG